MILSSTVLQKYDTCYGLGDALNAVTQTMSFYYDSDKDGSRLYMIRITVCVTLPKKGTEFSITRRA